MEALSTAVTEGSLTSTAASSRRRLVVAWTCVAAVVGLCASAAILTLAPSGESIGDRGFSLLVIPIAVVSAALGLLIRLRRPDNLVGWLLLANGLTLASLSLGPAYAYYGGVSHPGSLPGANWAALWSQVGWPGIYVFLMAIAFVFPNGRLPSRRWRWVAVATVIAYVGLELGFVFHPGSLAKPFDHLDKPTPSYPPSLGFVWIPFYVGVLGSLFAAFFAVFSRLRRADGAVRLQVLWFAYAAMLIPLALVVNILAGLVAGNADIVTGIAIFSMLIAVPAAVAVGILRYRLFDIELIINRTMVYGTLTVSTAIVYVAAVSGLDALVSRHAVSDVLAAGLVAAGFQPLRLRVQRQANRWVYGDRSNPYAALTRLGERLQGTLTPDEVVQTVVDSVAEALRLRYAAIEFDRHGVIEAAAAHGELRRSDLERLPLIYNGETIADLVVQAPPGRELTAADERLLGDLAQQAAPAVHAVRLNADLQLSREQLVAAREEERRRLRRDLHDGLGPTLAGIALRLDAARTSIEDPHVHRILGELRGETQDAIADVRRVVYELRPPALDELGLVGALREQGIRLSGQDGSSVGTVLVHFEVPDALPPLPAAVEVAAYRIATEALTNVARHAGARHCTIRLAMDEGLRLQVADDGRGIGRAAAGVGMTSMRERADELGGSCSVGPAPGGGTVVTAELPIDQA